MDIRLLILLGGGLLILLLIIGLVKRIMSMVFTAIGLLVFILMAYSLAPLHVQASVQLSLHIMSPNLVKELSTEHVEELRNSHISIKTSKVLNVTYPVYKFKKSSKPITGENNHEFDLDRMTMLPEYTGVIQINCTPKYYERTRQVLTSLGIQLK